MALENSSFFHSYLISYYYYYILGISVVVRLSSTLPKKVIIMPHFFDKVTCPILVQLYQF